MVKVTVCGTNVPLVNVPDISPVPLAAIPVTFTLLSLVQVYTVPATLPLSTIVVIADPEQIVCVAGVATAFGIGFTTTVALKPGPVQPLAIGVMVKVTVTGALLVFVKLPLIVPEPLAGMPVTVATLSRVQLNTVPATLPLGMIGVIADPEQMTWLAGAAVAFGVGFTNTVAVTGVPVQVTPALV